MIGRWLTSLGIWYDCAGSGIQKILIIVRDSLVKSISLGPVRIPKSTKRDEVNLSLRELKKFRCVQFSSGEFRNGSDSSGILSQFHKSVVVGFHFECREFRVERGVRSCSLESVSVAIYESRHFPAVPAGDSTSPGDLSSRKNSSDPT